LLHLARLGCETLGVLPRLPGGGQRRAETGRVKVVPCVVVVRADDVRDPPVRHGAAGVRLDRALEAALGLLVVEAVCPGETAVEPGLSLGRRGRDRAMVRAQVEVVPRRPRALVIATVTHAGAPPHQEGSESGRAQLRV